MKKILIIDYDQNALVSLQGILVKEGYQVVTAGDGQAGWDKFNKESPDLVLMEAMLPKVHGFELCQRITSERDSLAPVFIMTGVYKDRVYRTEALRTYGASEYFEKPLKMAELLASVEAVLGKPETKAAAAPAPTPAKPAKEAGPGPALVDPRKIEKPKPVEEEFAWSADLEKLRREMPKTKVRAPSHLEPSMEARLDTIANELLKTASIEPEPHPKAGEGAPQGHEEHKGNGNGNGNVDIDQFLKSALAGFDLDKDKVHVPKTAPLPPPPPPAERPVPPPVTARPKPTPPPPPAVAEKPAAERPWPVPVAPPAAAFSRPAEPAPSVTLTPGDPGSDASPFFTPEKKKTETPAEKPRPPLPPPAPKPPKAVEKTAQAKPETKAREAKVISSTPIFSEIGVDKPKKAISPLLAAGIGVAVIAVIGFIVLRPKRPAAPADDRLKSPQTVTQSNVAEKPAEEVPPPEAKPKPAASRPNVETQTKVAGIGLSSEDAILLPIVPAAMPSTIGNPVAPGDGKGQSAAGSQAAQENPPPVQTEGSAPPAKTDENPPLGEARTAANTESAAVTPAKLPVNEGDLVDLASVAEPPRALKTIDPVYPASAQRLGVEGSITVNALIDEKGNVIDTGILKGIQDDMGLGKAAETAMKKWKFQPAKKGGVAVKVWKSFVIVFKTAGKIG